TFIANGYLAAPGRAAEATMALRSEARVDTQPKYDSSTHVSELVTGRIERPLERLLDDLQVEGRVEPGGDGGIVIQLNRILVAEAQPELLAQERDKVPTELRARPADPEVVARPPGHEPLGADPDVVGVFDGVRHAVGSTEPEEDTDAPVGHALG